MIGYGPNKGIVPITCEELFNAIQENKDDKKQLRVGFASFKKEPVRKKSNNLGSDQVRHKAGCTVTEDG